MHLSNCLHPVRVYNKYSKEFMYVPCGKCEACRNARTNDWTARLRQEARCWKYVVFATLTYSMEKRPCFSSYENRIFVPELTAMNPELDLQIIDMENEYLENKCSDEWISRNRTWLFNVCQHGKLSHLSKYHVQLFVKRLRKHVKTLVSKKYGKDITLSDYLVRYYICGEYGSTAFAPHYHCLFFFNSEKEWSCFKEALYKSWSFGIVDCSLVRSDAAQYVAAYLNGYVNLPQIYQHPAVRPFALCSKNAPIGTLCDTDETLQEMFNSASYTRVEPAIDGKSFVNVPLWRCFKDRLFPRLPLFDRFSHSDRVVLYSAVQRFERFSGKEACLTSFLNYALYCYNNNVTNYFFCSVYRSYFDYLREQLGYDNKTLTNNILHWFYISNRVYYQSIIWSVDVSFYVSKIEQFYENCRVFKLREYFRFQEDYAEKYGCQSLVGLDLDFLNSFRYVELSDVSNEELLILQSYGIEVERFLSTDLSVRMGYFERLLPQNAKEFIEHYNNQRSIANKRVKNKKKNEYLENLHSPYSEFIKILASF